MHVEVGSVVCLIDTSAAKPEGGEAVKVAVSTPEVAATPKVEAPVNTTYATGSASPCHLYTSPSPRD